jgi:hypothetical protein
VAEPAERGPFDDADGGLAASTPVLFFFLPKKDMMVDRLPSELDRLRVRLRASALSGESGKDE